ncbi:hypothetical protein [Pararhizobium antarcticum]|uniref:Tat pathway signal protein n=1 Tax=Pararhizobium antarcticum TaxID=1798805 RepID=A0A657LSG7_9HYPH|nr:hypothetical protein [Pararhizobium antarcticum]OJF94348.1 hypothetical protein AX761_18650 [Rhizobium sp. 58]OJF96931.1 hypothetical protein AX760_03525 [Pararhizobium antarcticum]
MKRLQGLLSVAVIASACAGHAVFAQDAATAAAGTLSIELNDVVASEKGCKFTFVADNSLAQSLSKVSFEFVLFDQKGLVERMAVLDFRDLPSGKTKVRQFDLPGTKCEAVKSLLINDTPACTGEVLTKDACMKALRTGSKSPVELKG